MDVAELERALNITLSNKKLMIQAFTHSSYVNEHHRKHLADNERLEFLGDAVLELAVSDYLYNKFPKMTEGEMTKLRASIVCEESLFHFAEILEFSQYVLLGKGEERTGGRKRQALLADVFEAFLGALYLDQGMNVCQAFLERHIFPNINTDAFSYVMDYKTKLQEVIQQERGNSLQYRIIEEKGPAHRKEFVAEVIINGEKRTKGTGNSKKTAEQFAAKRMLEELSKNEK
ncbi:ribonuclease III [Pseudogracilibacillus sp. SE30717A]|uniref:ribonuclease III n=1 Tax=Pseudogracilibacillus sp. SE30717A TaxID=3098293 RepID=UPI00300E1274